MSRAKDINEVIRLFRARAEVNHAYDELAFAILQQAILDANLLDSEGVAGDWRAKTSEVSAEARAWLLGTGCRPVLRKLGIRHGWMTDVLVEHTDWGLMRVERMAA